MIDPLTIFLPPLGKDLVLDFGGNVEEVADNRPTLRSGDWASQRLLLCYFLDKPESDDPQNDVDELNSERHGG